MNHRNARSLAEGHRQRQSVTFVAQGDLLRARLWQPESRVGGGVRGRISGFSVGSRRRLLAVLARLQSDALPLFLTLTYPRDWSGDPRRWKRDLDTWLKRLRRRYPQAAAVWRLEPQRRGAPHYHLLVWGVPWMSASWLSRSWWEVVGSGDPAHLRAGTRVERVRSRRGVYYYAAKYLAKAIDDEMPECWRNPGRWWGVSGRRWLPWSPVRRWVVRADPRRVWAMLRDLLGLRDAPALPPVWSWMTPHAEAVSAIICRGLADG